MVLVDPVLTFKTAPGEMTVVIVESVPLAVPPIQFHTVLIQTGAEPVNVPPESCSLFMRTVSTVLKVKVPDETYTLSNIPTNPVPLLNVVLPAVLDVVPEIVYPPLTVEEASN